MKDWISVKKQLPEQYEQVLVVYKPEKRRERRYTLAIFMEDKFIGSYILPNVSYWMRIPEMPN